MVKHIDAILFDMGGTLRINTKRDETVKVKVIQQILNLLESDISPKGFTKLLTNREKAYEEWASNNLVELNETSFWTKWMLPDWPVELITQNAMKLNQIWRDAICTRAIVPDAKATVVGLYNGGYRLGLVSNTTSSVDSPLTLKMEGIAKYFDVVILSCVIGKRKPGPDILLEAADKIGILPEHCAYVGDRPDWDVVAARLAGFGKSVILRDLINPIETPKSLEQIPDLYIDNLIELLEIFPSRKDKTQS